MRFLHTSDWQLGMTRHFLSDDAQARYSDARLQAVRRVGALATDHGCAFVVVAGDVFESNQLDRSVIARACDALSAIPVPVLLLPGNHDPLDAACVFTSSAFTSQAPTNVMMLTADSPIRIGDVEVIGAPWRSKRPLVDLSAQACLGLKPEPGVQRVLVAHGAVDLLAPNPDDPALIAVSGLETAITNGLLDFVCLGDRHSVADIGQSGRIWYSGTPEVTSFREENAGNVLIVDLGVAPTPALQGQVRARPSVTPVEVGSWSFQEHQAQLNGDEDLTALETWLHDAPDKTRTVVKLSLIGCLSLAQKARLDAMLERESDVFAGVEVWERRTDLIVAPEAGDLDELGLTGFAADAVKALSASALNGSDVTAQDALSLLYRLAVSA